MTLASIPLTPQQLAVAKRLQTDLPFFSACVLKIRATGRGIISLVYNRVQDFLHYQAEDQKRRIGMVRKIVIKARQQTCSEYISSRGYHFATMFPAKSVYILSHEVQSTQTLFAKVDRYDRFIERDFPMLKPGTATANRHEKKFPNESEYAVGTAAVENTGRSKTIDFLHLSEPPQYPNPTGIKSGLLQCVADEPGTEVWWEGTAFGKNWVYDDVQLALAGKFGYYEVEFIPWFWTDRYRLKLPPSELPFVRTTEEHELSAQATLWNVETKKIDKKELTDEQLYWRRKKIEVIGAKLFKQEFPAYLEEAFQSSGDSFHDSDKVQKAMNCDRKAEDFSPLILGVDPARTGDDTILTPRKGCEVFEQIVYDDKEMNEMRLAGIISTWIDRHNPDLVVIDTGCGWGVIDRLHELGYRDIVKAVGFQDGADDRQYKNKRAEMAHRLDEWLAGEVNLPANPILAADIAAMPPPKTTSNGQIIFPPKADIKAKLGRSPDRYDSLLTTFAYNVRGHEHTRNRKSYTKNTEKGSALSTLSRLRKPKKNDDFDTSKAFDYALEAEKPVKQRLSSLRTRREH